MYIPVNTHITIMEPYDVFMVHNHSMMLLLNTKQQQKATSRIKTITKKEKATNHGKRC